MSRPLAPIPRMRGDGDAGQGSPPRASNVLEYAWTGRIAREIRMTIADMVYDQVRLLPDPLAREVLDFIGFLREGEIAPNGAI